MGRAERALRRRQQADQQQAAERTASEQRSANYIAGDLVGQIQQQAAAFLADAKARGYPGTVSVKLRPRGIGFTRQCAAWVVFIEPDRTDSNVGSGNIILLRANGRWVSGSSFLSTYSGVSYNLRDCSAATLCGVLGALRDHREQLLQGKAVWGK